MGTGDYMTASLYKGLPEQPIQIEAYKPHSTKSNVRRGKASFEVSTVVLPSGQEETMVFGLDKSGEHIDEVMCVRCEHRHYDGRQCGHRVTGEDGPLCGHHKFCPECGGGIAHCGGQHP